MEQIVSDSSSAVTPAPEYDYDRAFRIIKAVKRAAENPEFLEGVVYAYTELGYTDRAEAFQLAVIEQREFAADEAEFGNEVDHNKATVRKAQLAHDRRAAKTTGGAA